MNNNEFGELFKKLRLHAGIATLTELGGLLADKGFLCEDSLLSHWQNGRKVPTKRKILLTLLQIFHERKAITIQEANLLFQYAGQGYLTDEELGSLHTTIQINKPQLSNLNNSSKRKLSSEYLDQLLYKVRKLIADRGLDDENWSKAIHAQYFLINLARLLNLTSNSDYVNLLNSFLKSFYIEVDNSVVLSKDKLVVALEETSRIKQQMIEEDKRDNYYSRYSKNAAKNINMDRMNYNYHYAVLSQISHTQEFPNSITLKLIQELAIRRLIYGDGKSPVDDNGGWYPQRVPWLTARVLICLKNSGYAGRKDKDYIEKIASKAVDYLIRSIYDGKYWRSGVGDWVTEWESTALCLEAIDQWDKIKENESKILPVLKYVIDHEHEWLIEPTFATEKIQMRLLLLLLWHAIC